jgi:D-alanyl-D-alanine carboxypeptidase/D-alanyl-D-alanine-endopeptidase (penicillin-binding protein 4)
MVYSQKAEQALEKFTNTTELQNAHYGISIRELDTGKEIFNVNAHRSFAPASNLKLLYTLAAIDQKGKDFTYETRLAYNGKIVNNMLFGDLIFQASGDPSPASIRMKSDLNQLINGIISRIRSRGITKITGKLVMELNGWRYPVPGSIPVEDIGNYYGTGAWGFNFNDNRIDIYLENKEQTGEPVKVIGFSPEIKGIKYVSKVITDDPDTDDEAYIYAAPFDKTRYILGTIPAGKKSFKIKGGIPNPPESFLQLIKDKLLENHILVKDIQVRYQQNEYHHFLWKHQSPPLLDIVKTTNDYSMNHFSEALAWLLIQGDEPANGYLDKEKIHRFFVPYGFEEADIEDGCGLAPDNLVQPAQMTGFLSLMNQKLGKELLLDILPHGGEDGYAKYFLKNDKLQKSVWVKSGSVSKVQNYTGVFKARSGKYYAFSIMTNFFTGKHKNVRKAIERLVTDYMSIL